MEEMARKAPRTGVNATAEETAGRLSAILVGINFKLKNSTLTTQNDYS